MRHPFTVVLALIYWMTDYNDFDATCGAVRVRCSSVYTNKWLFTLVFARVSVAQLMNFPWNQYAFRHNKAWDAFSCLEKNYINALFVDWQISFFFCYQQFFYFSHTTQHNIQNTTKQNNRHILNISRSNQKGGDWQIPKEFIQGT